MTGTDLEAGISDWLLSSTGPAAVFLGTRRDGLPDAKSLALRERAGLFTLRAATREGMGPCRCLADAVLLALSRATTWDDAT
jgi:hypothetical protein